MKTPCEWETLYIFDSDDIDKQYLSLHCDIGVLNPKTDKYHEIVDYVRRSQSHHHPVNLIVKNIFTVKQHNAPEFDDSMGNVKELFHGTRSANLPGILSTHLKLPTQLRGVYITGAMFGLGLYFADQSTKSSQYSCSRFGGTKNKYPTAFMFLADVALGKPKKIYTAQYFLKPPKGYHSVMGVKGKILLHNEYVIYREAQQRLKYIIEFEAIQKIIKEECGMNYMDYNIADLKFMKMRRIPIYKSNPYDSFGLTIFEIKENLSMELLSIS